LTALDKYLAYALLLLLLLVSAFSWGHHWATKACEAQRQREQAAQAIALAQAQQAVIDVQNANIEEAEKVDAMYQAKLKDAHDAADRLTALLLRYKAELSSHPLPPVSPAAGQPPVAPTEPGGASAIDTRIGNAVQACEADAAQLQSLEDWVTETHRIFASHHP
jgi:hypothetical protein